MATSHTISDPYSGRTQYTCELYAWRYAISGTKMKLRWELRAKGSGTSYCLNNWSITVTIEGDTWNKSHNLDFRSSTNILLGSGETSWIEMGGSTRYINMYFKHGPDPCGIFGTAEKSGGFTADRIATVPGPPNAPVFTSATTTTVSFTIAQPPNNGGIPADTYQMQASENSAFTQIADDWQSGSSNQTATNLIPGTDYYVRYRAHNAVGWGAWSPTTIMTTLPATPPGILVAGSPSGQSATVTLTPPGGVTGVDLYDIQRRLQGSGSVVDASTPTTTYQVGGLTAGATYEWRARAHIGTYISPWSNWLAYEQPNPSTNPGAFFDGNSIATDDVVYEWTGTTNNSTSIAVGVGVEGWSVYGTAISYTFLQRVTGGQSQSYAARLMFTQDAVSDGMTAGQGFLAGERSNVVGNEVYSGSIYVQPSRSQRMKIRLQWRDSGGTQIDFEDSTPIVVAPDTWTRLSVTGTAPMNAVYATVVVMDATGTGWSLWQGGEYLLMDSAMIAMGGLINYFDGNTPDTPTLDYSWSGTENASTSLRRAVPAVAQNPLADPDCAPVPAPPRPPAVSDACVEDVVLWRRYWASIPSTEIAEWLDEIPSLTITTGVQAARQVRIRIYPNPDSVPIIDIDPESYISEQIISFIPANTEMLLDGVLQRVFASVDGAEPIAADHLLYGTGGIPATWPILSCGIGYAVSFDVDSTNAAGNITTAVSMTRRG